MSAFSVSHMPAHVPEWIPLEHPSEAHPAAHAAWIHKHTGAFLVKFWCAAGTTAGFGVWHWFVIHPAGARMCVLELYTRHEDDADETLINESATKVMRELERICGGRTQRRNA